MAQKFDISPHPSGAQLSRDRTQSLTVLLVDDDESVRKLITKFLTLSGFKVLAADCGPAAFPIWKEHKDSIDLLLTDMVMPEGISGLDLARRLQMEQPGLRVLFTSGYDAEIAGEGGVLREGLHFVQKPYRPEQLLAAVRDALADAASPVADLC